MIYCPSISTKHKLACSDNKNMYIEGSSGLDWN